MFQFLSVRGGGGEEVLPYEKARHEIGVKFKFSDEHALPLTYVDVA